MVNRTTLAWLATIAGLLVYEVYTLMNGIPGDTLSEAVWMASGRPLIPFLSGLVCGHFFWQRQGK